MNTEAQVTFVGGKAVEQTLPQESNLEPDERSEALAAVREAIEKAGKDSAEDAKSDRAKDPFRPAGTTPDRGADGKFLPKDEKPAAKTDAVDESEEVLDPEKASVKQLLKNREKLANMKRDAKDEISKARQAFDQERQSFARQQQQLQAEMQRHQQERQAWANLKKDPARAIREVGYDPEQFILDLAQDGTPEGALEREKRELRQQIKDLQDWKANQAKQAEEWQYQQQLHGVRQYRENAEKAFVGLAMTEDKYPHVAAFYKGREKTLIAEGDLTAEEYRSLSGGKEGSLEDILDYIEDQLAERTKSWYTKSKGAQKAEQPVKVSPQGNRGKSLSPEFSGERRALSQKDLRDLDGDERHEAAKQAVAVALAASRQSE